MVEDYSWILQKREELKKQLEQEEAFRWVPNRPEWNERDQEEYFRKRKEYYSRVISALQQKNIQQAKQTILSLINWELNYWAEKSRWYHSNMNGLGYADVPYDVEFLKKLDRLEQLQNPEILSQEIQNIVEQRKKEMEQQLQREAQLNERKRQLILQNVQNLGGNIQIANRMIQKRIDEPFEQEIEQKNQELQQFAQQTTNQKIGETKKEIEKILSDFVREYRNDAMQEVYSRRRRWRQEDREYFQKLQEKLREQVESQPFEVEVNGAKIEVQYDKNIDGGSYIFRPKGENICIVKKHLKVN